jgi:ribosome-binding protein aMBF1 (putative translation factor)
VRKIPLKEGLKKPEKRLKDMSNKHLGHTWAEVRGELFTPEEIAASDLRVALIGELIKARNERGISQKKLEELSGVKQPVIARMERGNVMSQIDTVLKVLAPLGKTLAIVPLKRD